MIRKEGRFVVSKILFFLKPFISHFSTQLFKFQEGQHYTEENMIFVLFFREKFALCLSDGIAVWYLAEWTHKVVCFYLRLGYIL